MASAGPFSNEQKMLYDYLRSNVVDGSSSVSNDIWIYKRHDRAFLCPEAEIGLHMTLSRAMLVRFTTLEQARLDPTIKEVVILVTCSHFRGWNIQQGPNMHERVVFQLRPALGTVLSPAQVRALKNGARPADLSESCGAAFDLTRRMVNEGGPLTGSEREDFERRIGRNILDVLIGYCGLYAQQCIYLMGWIDPQSEGRMIRSRVTASETVLEEDESGSVRAAKQANYLVVNGVVVYQREHSETS